MHGEYFIVLIFPGFWTFARSRCLQNQDLFFDRLNEQLKCVFSRLSCSNMFSMENVCPTKTKVGDTYAGYDIFCRVAGWVALPPSLGLM